MIKEFKTTQKYLLLFVIVLMGVSSCKNDFNNVGVDVVDNAVFDTNKYTSEVTAYSKNITRNQTNNFLTKNSLTSPDTSQEQLLGVVSDDVFGKLTSSIVSQLILPKRNPEYELETVIDTVIFNLPFDINKTWSSGTSDTFKLDVFELGTFLHANDPEDPTKVKRYYSDDVFLKNELLFSGNVAAQDPDSTVIVKHYRYPNYPDLSIKEHYTSDTIIGSKPSLRLGLNVEFFKTHFIDMAAGSEFGSQANFQHYFRGLYIEASELTAGDGSLLALSLPEATVTIYYSYSLEGQDEGEDEDLDGNGIPGELGVKVRKTNKSTYNLGIANSPLSAISVGLDERDYNTAASAVAATDYLSDPDTTNGEEKLFVQGVIGSHAVVQLFGTTDADANGIPDELDLLRTKKWLVNDAILTFYVDDANISDTTAESLYVYALGDEEATQLYHAQTETPLERDDDDKPIKYTVHLTDYIAELIKPDSEVELTDLGIKVFENTDHQVDESELIRENSINPNSVVLKGNLPVTSDERIRLEIFYSEKN